MSQEKFIAIMPLISADLVAMIAEKQNINKIDVDSAMVDVVTDQVVDLLGCKPEDILLASGKTGQGVKEAPRN